MTIITIINHIIHKFSLRMNRWIILLASCSVSCIYLGPENTVNKRNDFPTNIPETAEFQLQNKLNTRILEKGDKLVIYLKAIPVPEEIKDVIDHKGEVNLPYIGRVCIAGKSTSDAEKLIEQKYIDEGYYKRITVIIVAQEKVYYVRGEVNRPGVFEIRPETTLLQAIASAGGYTKWAKKTQVKILRDKTILIFDTTQIEGGIIPDPVIEPGDIIVVPQRIL